MSLRKKNEILQEAVEGLVGESVSYNDFLQQGNHTLDSDQERLFRKLAMVAENDGAAYKSRNARGAAMKAAKGCLQNTIADLKHDLKKVEPVVEAYLKARWDQQGREAKRY